MRRKGKPTPSEAKRRRAFRLRLDGMSQAAAAVAVGVSLRTMQRWERGAGRRKGWTARIAEAGAERERRCFAEDIEGYCEPTPESRAELYGPMTGEILERLRQTLPGVRVECGRDAAALAAEWRRFHRLENAERKAAGLPPVPRLAEIREVMELIRKRSHRRRKVVSMRATTGAEPQYEKLHAFDGEKYRGWRGGHKGVKRAGQKGRGKK